MVVNFLATNVNTFSIVYAFSQMYSLFGIGKLFLNFPWKPRIWMECCPNNFMLYVLAQKKDRILVSFAFLIQREQFFHVSINFKIFKWNEFDVTHFNNNRKKRIWITFLQTSPKSTYNILRKSWPKTEFWGDNPWKVECAQGEFHMFSGLYWSVFPYL